MRRFIRRLRYSVCALYDFLQWIRRRDSVQAVNVVIDVCFDLDKKDLIAMRDLLDSLHQALEDSDRYLSLRTKAQ